jgi:protein TonB
MGYQALLFCPDEKTVRTVTQVLSELEFNVESCTEPFAAVKKLMGQHFDAVVVDCDNEQNATLLFKSARNSTSNQASLAVAVVEGQAGVAKAFRIGANLVLTKPINLEQAKGTLRVARGLLRKGDPSKPAGAAHPAPVAASPASSSPAPAVPSAKPARPAPTAAPEVPAAISTPAAPAPPTAKPAARTAWPAVATATSSRPTASNHEDDLLEISAGNTIPKPSTAAIPGKASFSTGLPAQSGSGAASAPAPARESHVTKQSPEKTADDGDVLLDQPAGAVPSGSPGFAGPEPTFTFGGANVPAESNSGSKKILLGAAAAAIVAAGLYVGWTQFQGHASQSASNATAASTPASKADPGTAQPPVKPSGAQTVSRAPTTSAQSPKSSDTVVAPSHQPVNDSENTSDEDISSKPGKTDSEIKPAAAPPLIIKGGTAPVAHAKTAAVDAPAPGITGIAMAGAGAPPPDLVSDGASQSKPVLQTLNISQGVSQGLLIKKAQPIYPRNALNMRVEGSVELMATVSKTGDITRVKVLSGDSQLSKAAIDAVKQWKYKPYLLNGEPVEIQTQVTINFKLPR